MPDYPLVSIKDIVGGKFDKLPRARVTGTITAHRYNPDDGDTHVQLSDDGGTHLVTEVIPELPLTIPPKGTKVWVNGIVRFDGEHGFWEIHPVTGIETAG